MLNYQRVKKRSLIFQASEPAYIWLLHIPPHGPRTDPNGPRNVIGHSIEAVRAKKELHIWQWRTEKFWLISIDFWGRYKNSAYTILYIYISHYISIYAQIL